MTRISSLNHIARLDRKYRSRISCSISALLTKRGLDLPSDGNSQSETLRIEGSGRTGNVRRGSNDPREGLE
jgi:hypothetical protein